MNKTWLIYALGGGWGHLTRALSLGRIAAKYRKVRVITNSPYAQQVSNEGCLIDWIPDDAGFSATCIKVREILLSIDYDCLIVDTFPRGLGGELADILPQLHSIPRILIHRDINPQYIIAKNLRDFVAANFDLVIVPGEGTDLGLCDLPTVQYTAPWLIRNAEELPERDTTRSPEAGLCPSLILRVDKFVKIILVCAAGTASELDIFSQLALRLHEAFPECAVRILAANCPVNCPESLWISHHPGIECLAAADVVVGGGGYNTVYECAAVGVPLVALAFPRLYDRQEKRASKSYYVQNIEQAIATVRILLNPVKTAKKQSASAYINGAVQAVHQIMSYKL
ncbi:MULTISPECIES: UDP-N-acetylglucosamine--LPS N-acetylglucosamine transferase [unclassified Nodularia (in: cyanobacteria)]|uniref:UDP-N-acetylglucosamine--LPS N-acetylglucosamine transferase n=1 Tax=unclassified Nodularia (in: cyanobacteria) TaxID=2656917 RepID=UPI00187FED5F|nr:MULTISPECIES: UDP-N-acetylglucosamine--LPS N-acetylglucosamine transferase [unclassified Nodularia (in: cyanobacteria)]MBE9199681.1 UDP-N-acetylglucosamine--LPS N-acetylglucosamine transferase [Nodularia sp. LEGE 06071]MCC2692209.1 UDP-N-acetylglucosamine--LPS N-acetylglucosamine transferase [Nodularia sp. LEGE 04288]